MSFDENKQVADLEAQNQDVNDNTANDDTQTDEGVDANDSGKNEDVEKQEGDQYYANELKRIEELEREKADFEEQLKEKQRQIEIKDRALQKIKTRRDETKVDSTTKEELFREWEERQAEKEALAEIKRMAPDAAAQKLVMHHYKNSIVRTGDVQDDISAAFAVANRKRVNELMNRERQQDEHDDLVASSMSSQGTAPSRGRMPPSKLRQQIESMVPKEARGLVGKHMREK